MSPNPVPRQPTRSLDDEVTDFLFARRDDLLADPFPLYRRLRDEAPVYRHELTDSVILSRYSDISHVSLNHAAFGRQSVTGSATRVHRELAAPDERDKLEALLAWNAGFISQLDGAAHRRLRDLTRQSFAKRALTDMRGHVQDVVDELLDALAGRNEIELIDDFAYQLPLIVISEMLDVPIDDRHLIRAWTTELGQFIGLQRSNVPRAYQALVEFRTYIGTVLEARRSKAPAEDLLGTLIGAEDDGDRLDDDELFTMMTLFLFAGHETTTNLIGNGMLACMRNRSQWDLLCARRDLVPSAVEEFLRYDPPVFVNRIALTDTEIAGHPIAKGQTVEIIAASANRDPEAFDDPDTFDITRTSSRHLGFGVGVHHCLGNQLARMEVQLAVESLSRRFPRLALAVEDDALEWRQTPKLRGVKALPLAL